MQQNVNSLLGFAAQASQLRQYWQDLSCARWFQEHPALKDVPGLQCNRFLVGYVVAILRASIMRLMVPSWSAMYQCAFMGMVLRPRVAQLLSETYHVLRVPLDLGLI